MNSSEYFNTKRLVAGIMAMMLFIVVLLSVFYLSNEIEHDCSGEDCPICECIQQCESILQGTGMLLFVQVAAIVALFFFKSIVLPVCSFTHITPVSTRVRMNN